MPTRRSATPSRRPTECSFRPRAATLLLAALLPLAACGGGGAVLADGGPLAEAGRHEGGADGRADLRSDGGGALARCEPSAALLARVDPARMLADLRQLAETLPERRSAAGQQAAAAYLRGQLAALPGLQLKEQSYNYKGQSYVNLEVVVVGSDAAGAQILAGAHYDSTSADPKLAPGADDNATGTVAVLEAARVLAGCQPRRGVRLVFFSNEEVGTVGSLEYVKQLKAALPPSQATGFIALDMIGYSAAGQELTLATRPVHQAFADATRTVVERWTPLKVKVVVGDQCG